MDKAERIAGGLAGILYGRQGIPQKRIDALARKDMVENVYKDLSRSALYKEET